MSLVQFVAKWCHPDYPPRPVSAFDLSRIESHFKFHLPEDYKAALQAAGLPRPSIKLLDAIVDRELAIHDAGGFYNAEEVIEQTSGWRKVGLPQNFVAFAGDGSGNMFCFNLDMLKRSSVPHAAVWLFDHDFIEMEIVAESFDDWIAAYCAIEPV